MTMEALKEIEGVTSREAERSKNFFALGLMSWLYHRPIEGTLSFIERKFAKRPEIVEANTKAFRAGGTTARPPRTSPSRTSRAREARAWDVSPGLG